MNQHSLPKIRRSGSRNVLKTGFTLIEMCLVVAIGAALSLGLARLLRTLMVNLQQEQSRLSDEQQAEDVIDPLIAQLKNTDPASITLLSPDGISWSGLRFINRNHVYSLYQSGSLIQWQVDQQPPKPWLRDAYGLHVAVDHLRDPGMLWIAFQLGKNKVLFARHIALQHPE